MRKRIFSGIQPSGKLHIGNYLGAIKNWIGLQDEYDCIWGIVDFHSMTIPYDPEGMEGRVIDCAATYLAAGLDPQKCVLMIQSKVKEHTELTWILNTVTPVSWLERVPTFKDKSKRFKDNINMGLMDYPVLMAADIILYKAEAVPVGEDQLPHLELSREIVRRFNSTFGNVFPEPKAIIRQGALIRGLDGQAKMSKSLDNCLYIDDTPEDIWKKLSVAVTDPQRVRKTDPGNPDVCNVFSLHQLFSNDEQIEYCAQGCKTAGIGCIQCKKILSENISQELAPIRENKQKLLNNMDYIKDVLTEGVAQSQKIASKTIEEVYEKIGTNYKFMK
ncbi:MAG TPA: tryptophan--tRNA ligase [Candidatus Cloacimonetes bacterium]|nr:tryptophan--tRNA ligase [Candidatus Cloacimonadota bacterium]HHE40197.1 tryptophan--tRNA ligase [Candidatus Cloacimonadota bacterium]